MASLGKAEKYHEKMKLAESVAAQRNPILEAEYHVNRGSEIHLYESYLPQLK